MTSNVLACIQRVDYTVIIFYFGHVTGRLYITGGLTSPHQAEVTTIASHGDTMLAPLPPMLEGRRSHATAAAGPLLFVFGGINGLSEVMSSCEFLDTRTNT